MSGANADLVRRWIEVFNRGEIEAIEEHGERVLAIQRLRGAGAASGAGAEVLLTTITSFRDGEPVRTEEFLDPGEARRRLEG